MIFRIRFRGKSSLTGGIRNIFIHIEQKVWSIINVSSVASVVKDLYEETILQVFLFVLTVFQPDILH